MVVVWLPLVLFTLIVIQVRNTFPMIYQGERYADNPDMYSNATDVPWTISNISYNVMQMRYDENDGRGNETNTR
jgi:hypothetical protein